MGLGLSHPTPASDAIAAVLRSQDLLSTIVSYQRGLPESLAPLVPGLRRMAHRHKQRISAPDPELDARLRVWLAAHDVEELAPLLRDATLQTGLRRLALVHGHLNVIAFVAAATCVVAADWLLAASNGHTSVLDCLEARDGPYPRGLMECGVSSNQLNVVVWAHTRQLDVAFNLRTVAAERGFLEILTYLDAHSLSSWDPVAVSIAAERGYLDVLRFLHAKKYTGFSAETMNVAAAHGHREVVRFLHMTHHDGCSAHALVSAARNGDLDTVRFLLEHRSEGNLDDAIAAAHHQPAVLELLLEKVALRRLSSSSSWADAYGAN